MNSYHIENTEDTESLDNEQFPLLNWKYITLGTLCLIVTFFVGFYIGWYVANNPSLLNSENDGYVDLGLPSGTLWKNQNEDDMYYSWDQAMNLYGDNMPTKEQCEELLEQCTWTMKYEVQGPNGNIITFPASGYRYCNGDVDHVGTSGFYWTSTSVDYFGKAYRYYFNSNGKGISENKYCGGQSVRLVKDY